MMNPQLKIYLDNLAPKITEHQQRLLDSPLFILSAPRSGSTLLMEILSAGHHVVTIRRESNIIYKEFEHLHASYNNYESGCLTAKHADQNTKKYIRLMYFSLMQDTNCNLLVNKSSINQTKPYCFIEKTPRNALNIPFLLEIFPQAQFLVLFRKPEETISSLIEAWQVSEKTGQFISQAKLPGWHLPYWCFLLPPNWQSMIGKSLVEIAAFQWQSTYDIIIKDLNKVDDNSKMALNFTRLLDNSETSMKSIYDFLKIPYKNDLFKNIKNTLKPSKSTVTKPAEDKWLRHKELIIPLLNKVQPTQQKLDTLFRDKSY